MGSSIFEMPRTIRSTKLDTRHARTKLKVRREPYWHVIAPGHALGYRRGNKCGTWVARLQESKTGHKYYHSLGYADDLVDTNDTGVLSFAQAQERARGWFKTRARALAQGLSDDAAKRIEEVTVSDAADDYLKWYEAHRKGYAQTKAVVEAHIRPTLGAERLATLTSSKIRNWQVALAKAAPKGRTGKPLPRTTGINPRARQATANRILTVLKAMLNKAYYEGMAESDTAWRRIQAFCPS